MSDHITIGSTPCNEGGEKIAADEEKRNLLREYSTHSALNLGQAARDIRYFLDHPHADKVAPKGSAFHAASSASSRLPSLLTNLYYATIPPHLHHTKEELSSEKGKSHKKMFLEGYAPWKYKDKIPGGLADGRKPSAYAYACESDSPQDWDEEAKKELGLK